MRAFSKAIILGVVLLGSASVPALAQDTTDDRLKALEDRIQSQDVEIQRLKEELAEQAGATADLGHEIDAYLSKESNEAWWAEPDTLRPFFSPGLRLYSPDKRFQLRVGGRIMFDIVAPGADDELEDFFEDDFDSMYEFRRARLFMQGTIYDNVSYKAQYGFAGEAVDFEDVWINVDFGFTNIKIGNSKVPYSLEELTSSKYITFMERAMLTEAFGPSRNPNIMAHNGYMDGKLNYMLAWFFQNGDTSGKLESNLGARVTYAPILENKGEELLHFGASILVFNPDESMNAARFRARPNVHTVDRFADTGSFDADGWTTVGFEGAFGSGPFSAQAEVAWVSVDSDEADDPSFFGFYIYASYFLTGEHRAYKKGTFDRIKVNENFGDGSGAWELGARYDYIDLTDSDAEGGEVSTFTLGLTWYLNRATRFMLNYVHANATDTEGSDLDAAMDAIMFRFQIDF